MVKIMDTDDLRTSSYYEAVQNVHNNNIGNRINGNHKICEEIDSEVIPEKVSHDKSTKPAVSFHRLDKGERHPIDQPLTNPLRWLSYITFSYLNPICRIGAKRQLNSEDLYTIPSMEEARQLTDRMQAEWECQLSRPKGSLRKAYWRCFRGIWIFTTFLLLVETLLQVAEPVMLGRIVRNLQNDGDPTEAFKWAGGLLSAVIVHIVLHHVAYFFSWRCGYELIASTIGLIYRKALRINRQSFSQLTTGHVVNLVSNDVERFVYFSVMGHFLYLAPLQLAIGAFFIWQQLGPVSLVGVGLYILLLPINFFLGKAFANLRNRTALLTDERVKTVNEVLTGMRVLKMYGWEEPFRKVVQNIRRQELSAIKRTNIIRGSNMAFFAVSAVLSSFLSFIAFHFAEGGITAEKAFTTIAIFQAVRLNIAFFFPTGIQSISELSVSVRRFERFLRLEEHKGVTSENHISSNFRSFASPDFNLSSTEDATLQILKRGTDPFVLMTKFSAKWADIPTLQNVSLTAKPGKLVAIVGPVGSGKTSLLLSVLGELDPVNGAIFARGSTGYASQEPWILNASIRDNILFGRDYDSVRFANVIRTCQLTTDLSLMPDSASTDIGERGVTLSGGQKARLSLARAVYADADIYLLDDPLSAVDAKVGRRLFEDCIKGTLRNKVCILVTHQLHFLREADELIVMDSDGTIQSRGTFDEIMSKGSALADILKQIDAASADQDKHDVQLFTDTNATTLVDKEYRKDGVVGFDTYWQYIKAATGAIIVAVLWMAMNAITQALQIGADWFLSYWVDLEEEERNRDRNIIIYSLLVGLFTILCFARAVTFMLGAARASDVLNNTAFKAVVGAPVRFFDTNPIGRILNRFSKDMGFLDDLLPWTFFDLLQLIFLVLGIVLLVCIINPWLFLSVLPLAIAFRLLQRYFLKTAREIKRLEATNRSPVYSHFSSSLSGLTTLRSQDAMTPFIRTFEHFQNEHGKAYIVFIMISRWLGVRLDMITFVFTVATLLGSLALRDTLGAGEVGLAVSYVLQLTNMFQWFIRQGAEVENQMTSIERIIEYGKLEPEERFVSSPFEEEVNEVLLEKCSSKHWPPHGKVAFNGLSLHYGPDEPLRLDNINCIIPPCAKVGIVGRTGAGKSSLLAALFRLAPTTGDILIDDVPARNLPLHLLRRKIGVIPQDPVLFSGPVRYNLDPFSESDDASLWEALRLVRLDRAVSALPGGLDEQMTEAGGNFSVGQRQLICMARAILQSSRILVMDEATANVDTETDRLIQLTIREQFHECTVLTIAHRLHTIMDCDLIMVMDAGKLVEFAPPEDLIRRQTSIFASLAQQARLKQETVIQATKRRKSSMFHLPSNI